MSSSNLNDKALSLSNSLTDLAARIQAEHEACESALKRGLEHAVAAGKLLIEAKAQLKHGQWLPWLRDHCRIPERTARRYMEIAPYAADQIGHLADLTISQPPPLTEESTWDEISAWTQWHLDAPFTEADCQGDFVISKLLHQAGVPTIPEALLSSEKDCGLPLLRLCSFDDLNETAKALAAAINGDRVPKVTASSMIKLQGVVAAINLWLMWLLGGVLNEIDHRCKRGYTEEQYQREWKETHTAWMAWAHAQLAELERGDKGADDA
jgi:hypothetical protein